MGKRNSKFVVEGITPEELNEKISEVESLDLVKDASDESNKNSEAIDNYNKYHLTNDNDTFDLINRLN